MISSLKLDRLAVFRGGTAVYSEQFHSGVNIIHGDNGSGKSTITDFVFFALGGDLRIWKPHALICDFVVAEISHGDSRLTLRRDVSSDGMRGMQIFFGPFDEAMAAGPTTWGQYPYRRSSAGFNFTQVLFRALGLPDSISAGNANITMHQILRLMYVDQMTPIQRIFRQENFDTWEMRQAAGDFLAGLGGHDLYEKQLSLRALNAEFDELARKLRSLMTVAASYGDDILIEYLEETIRTSSTERADISKEIAALLGTEEPSALDEESKKVEKRRVSELLRIKREVSNLEDRFETVEYEIEDSEKFISYLRRTLSEFDDSASTFFSLGQVRFEYCPACFTPTSSMTAVEHGHCHLCGTLLPQPEGSEKGLAARLDLSMQLQESEGLLAARKEDRSRLAAVLRTARTRLAGVAEAVETLRKGIPSKRETQLTDLSRRAGFLDSEIAVLSRRLELAKEIEALSASKEEMNSRISRLKDEIEATIVGQQRRKSFAYTLISDRAKFLLENDMPAHTDLVDVKNVTFSFAEDWIAVNGEKNRAGSASGMVILKNSFLVGFLLASIEDPQFFLPRFMVLDNVEDKGMVRERSWHFQKIITKEMEKRTGPQQLIFTTSHLAPELDDPKYVVGRKYTKLRPSLEFSPM